MTDLPPRPVFRTKYSWDSQASQLDYYHFNIMTILLHRYSVMTSISWRAWGKQQNQEGTRFGLEAQRTPAPTTPNRREPVSSAM